MNRHNKMLLIKQADCYICNILHHWKKTKDFIDKRRRGVKVAKYLEVNLTRNVQGLCEGNYKALLKVIKKTFKTK